MSQSLFSKESLGDRMNEVLGLRISTLGADPFLGLEDPLRPTSRKHSKIDAVAQFHGVAERLSLFQMIISIIATSVGAGIVGMPIAATLTGNPTFLIGLLFIGILAWFSSVTLLNTTEIVGATTYDGVSRGAIRRTSISTLFSEIPLLCVASLGCTAYVSVVADAIDSYARMFDFHLHWATRIILATTVMSALCFYRSYSQLKMASNLTTITFVLTFFIVLWKSVSYRGEFEYKVPPVSLGSTMLSFSQLSTAYLFHFNMPGLYAELERKSKPYSSWGVLISLVVAWCVYAAGGSVCLYYLGDLIGPNILKTLSDLYDNSDVVLLGTQGLLAFGLILKTPLVNFPIKTVLINRWGKTLDTCSAMENLLCTLASRLIVCILALLISELDLALQIVGATCGSLLLFISPAIFGFALEEGILPLVRNSLLIVYGVSISCLSLYFLTLTLVKRFW